MRFQSYNNFLNNQGLGYIPIFLLTLLSFLMPYKEALFISWFATLFFVGVTQFLSERIICRCLLNVSIVIMLLYSLLLLLIPQQKLFLEYSTLILELITIAVLIFVNLFRNIIKKQIIRRTDKSMLVPIKNTLYELFLVIQIFQNTLTLHLSCVLFVSLLPSKNLDEIISGLYYKGTLLLIPLLVILYEYLRLYLLNWNLKQEKWLPIINPKGNIVGIVAEKEKEGLSPEYRIPVVRTVLMYENQLLLAPIQGTPYIDTPIDAFVTYGSSAIKVQADALHQIGLKYAKKSRFLISYLYDYEKYKTVNSLYIYYIANEKIFKKIKIEGAKLWTQKQIEENIGKNCFSKCFEWEYGLFNNTIFLPEIT